ncbi:MAG: helix-turn-helix transcriptional regulator, partial [Draconibacterium sp.]|nr:helix-turn-helix transcriptional regulator [Draconibacterium sp.]
MTDLTNADKEFLEKLEQIVKENVENEKFGVSELAKELSMSRSNLHRKVNSLTKISVSQYIRQERLKNGRDMLRKTSLTVSEVAYKVGFSSTSYFIKCFHDYFGYPPGEVGKRDREAQAAIPPQTFETRKKRSPVLLVTVIIVLVIATVIIILEKPFSLSVNQKGQVIAVLPLQNVSGDEGNDAMTDNVHDALTTEL